jgi:ubiquinone/menaquinone biosynthesis C-methylase UbiE
VQVLLSDNLALPYRDESFDAVLSIAVIHHIATTERRVRAIRELARILRYTSQLYRDKARRVSLVVNDFFFGF